MKNKITIHLKEYKGKKLEFPAYISCEFDNLAGDCSGYTVGIVHEGNHSYLPEGDSDLMYKLMVHRIVNNNRFQSSRSDEDWCNKYVFSGPSETWKLTNPLHSLYTTFLSMSKHKEQGITTRGWHGGDYDIRVVTLPKYHAHHIPLEGIEWEGMNVRVETMYNNQQQSGATATELRSLDAEITRHGSW